MVLIKENSNCNGGIVEKSLKRNFDYENNVVSGVLGSSHQQALHKRVKPSPEFNLQKEIATSQENNPPLGLKLTKTPYLLNLLETTLSQKGNSADQEVCLPMLNPDKLKASNFSAALLQIGSWRVASRTEGGIIAKCYFSKKKIVWEILDGSLKTKIEFHWSNIIGINAVLRDNEPGILELELNHPPLFFREGNPQPRKHTSWKEAEDLTGGQAPIYRRHYIVFPPGVLDKPYQKLIHCDKRLYDLTRKPFPTKDTPFFYKSIASFPAYSPDPNGNGTVIAADIPYYVPNFPAVVPPKIVQNYISKPPTLPHVILESPSPISVMEFPHLSGTASNSSTENPAPKLCNPQGQESNINQGQSSNTCTTAATNPPSAIFHLPSPESGGAASNYVTTPPATTRSPAIVIADFPSPISASNSLTNQGQKPVSSQVHDGVNNNKWQSSMPMATHGSQVFPPMISVENPGNAAPNNEHSVDESVKLLGDGSKFSMTDQEFSELLQFLHSFLDEEELKDANNAANVVVNDAVSGSSNFGTNNVVVGTNQFCEANDGLVFMPQEVSNVANMTGNFPTTQPFPRYPFAGPRVEDFAPICMHQNVHRRRE